jgi:hypothetical protein
VAGQEGVEDLHTADIRISCREGNQEMITTAKTVWGRGPDIPDRKRKSGTQYHPEDIRLSSHFLIDARAYWRKYYFLKLRFHSAIFPPDGRAGKQAVMPHV